MKPSLVIMAAGLGTRYKGGIKAMIPVGPSGELLFSYGVYDALEAGFGKIIFVLRQEIEKDFKELYGRSIQALCDKYGAEMACVNQRLEDIPFGTVPEGRVKPWGTCHAVLAARDEIEGPFCVMNADDYYGKTAFSLIADFLMKNTDETLCCMAGFRLMNTLSDFGGVTRGICKVDDKGIVSSIAETRHVIKDGEGASADGVVLDTDALVSMNIWGFGAGMVIRLKQGFESFLQVLADPLTSEFLLPIFVNKLIADGEIRVQMLESPDKWFGMTYSSDRETTIEAIRELVNAGEYPENLFA